MESTPSSESTGQQRILAAIVFTDVVGFSKLAGQNESRAFVAVQRDMTMMQNLCRSHRGEVLNTMGDGMMMSFASAVDAMACALEIQRTLYSQSKSLPPGDRLQHRIGVHLGDIIRDGTNVFGDGVNIAARLQAAAKPDAICFSQTVREVVKNKLKYDEEPLHQQQLKNVGLVKMWQVPPIREYSRVTSALTENPIDTSIHGGARGFRAFGLIIASIVLLSGLGAALLYLKKPKIKESNGKNASALAQRLSAVKKKNTAKDASNPTDPGTETPPTKAPSGDEAVQALVKRYDFEAAIAKLNELGQAKTPAGESAIGRYRSCSEMWTWLQSEVSSATVDKPILTTLLADDGKYYPAKVYQGKQGAMVDFGSKPMDQSLRDFKPESILSLAKSIAAAPVTVQNANAPSWIGEFQKEFNITA